MKKAFLILLFTTIYLTKAKAAVFGKDENLHAIEINNEKIPVEDGNTNCYLGFKTSGYYFIAGLYLKNDGYVLIEQANQNTYFPLTENDIAYYQKQKILPTPLPTYKVPIVEYLLGFSLWIIVIGVFLYAIIKRTLFGNDNEAIVDDENKTKQNELQ